MKIKKSGSAKRGKRETLGLIGKARFIPWEAAILRKQKGAPLDDHRQPPTDDKQHNIIHQIITPSFSCPTRSLSFRSLSYCLVAK